MDEQQGRHALSLCVLLVMEMARPLDTFGAHGLRLIASCLAGHRARSGACFDAPCTRLRLFGNL